MSQHHTDHIMTQEYPRASFKNKIVGGADFSPKASQMSYLHLIRWREGAAITLVRPKIERWEAFPEPLVNFSINMNTNTS
jgi:hypothetical protein